jgi:ribosomal protein L24E
MSTRSRKIEIMFLGSKVRPGDGRWAVRGDGCSMVIKARPTVSAVRKVFEL